MALSAILSGELAWIALTSVAYTRGGAVSSEKIPLVPLLCTLLTLNVLSPWVVMIRPPKIGRPFLFSSWAPSFLIQNHRFLSPRSSCMDSPDKGHLGASANLSSFVSDRSVSHCGTSKFPIFCTGYSTSIPYRIWDRCRHLCLIFSRRRPFFPQTLWLPPRQCMVIPARAFFFPFGLLTPFPRWLRHTSFCPRPRSPFSLFPK